jgi:hypothetical protein
MVPKNFRNNINIHPSKIGFPRRQEILDGIADKGTFLPRGVSEEDMDQSFVDFVKNDLQISIEGVRVPVLFLTIQRWSEFTKTWSFTEGEYKDLKMPFITVVRKPDIQVGNNQAGLWNIPGNRTYTYMKVPTFDGARKGVDLYKIPQPTSVDIGYEIRVFTGKMKDLNKFNTKIHKSFQSRQFYIWVKGHPMPVILESISDESNIDDFENRRFYIQQFEMTLQGYLLDEEDYEVVPTINRSVMFTEIENFDTKKGVATYKPKIKNNDVDYTFVFNEDSELQIQFTSNFSVVFSQISNISNVSRIIINVNNINVLDGLTINSPIIFNYGDTINITIERPNNSIAKFILIGTL